MVNFSDEYMGIFDSHSHYDDKKFDLDRDFLLKELLGGNICNIINVGADVLSSQKSAEIAHKYKNIYFAAGVHPHEAARLPKNYLSQIRKLAQDKKCVAIGEIGLDYYYDFSPKDSQKVLFEEQLQLAHELNMPVIIHSRDASADSITLLQKYKPRGVVHCFTQSAQSAKVLLGLGMYIGITGVVTFKNARKIIDVVNSVPTERLLLETDCPYMSPEPYRGKRCDSSLIKFTAQKIATIKNMEVQTLINICRQNTFDCFNIHLQTND